MTYSSTDDDSETESNAAPKRRAETLGAQRRDRVRLSIRVISFLARVGPLPSDDVARPESTQRGIARGLGTTIGAVSKVLSLLVEAQIVRRERRHVRGQVRRVRVYFLTVQGDRMAQEIVTKLGSARSDDRSPDSVHSQ